MTGLPLATRGRLDPSCLGGVSHGYIIPIRTPILVTALAPSITASSDIRPEVGPGQVKTPSSTLDLWRDLKPINRG